MPFADFLATVGQGAPAGAIGQYFGGRTPGQQRVEEFNAQMPAIYDAFDKATTRDEIEKAGRLFSTAWTRAGGPMDERFDKFADRLTGTALNRVQQSELEGIRRDYGPQTTPITPQVAPEGQGQPFDLGTTFTPQTTPARNPMADPEGAFRMFQATGAKPEHLENIFQAPAKIAGEEAKSSVERERVLAAQRKARTIESLPDTPQPGGMISPRSMAAIHEPGLTQYEPQRERPADPLQDLKERRMEAQIQRLERPAAEQRARQYHVDAGDRIEVYNTDTNELIRSIPKAAITTETTGPVKGVERVELERSVARLAADRGIKTSQGIKDLFRSQGYEIEGDPVLNVPGPTQSTGLIGSKLPAAIAPVERDKEGRPIVKPPTLTGDFNIISKPKTVTRGPAGAAPPAPQGQPAGTPAAPRVGTVVRGYRFKGGDPANQANWEQVR